jgi:hypothetical protein
MEKLLKLFNCKIANLTNYKTALKNNRSLMSYVLGLTS